VPDVAALGASDEVRGAADGAERAHRRVHATRDDCLGALEPRLVALGHHSLSASSRAKYVRMMSAPARLTAVMCSSATASPSIHPFSAAALIMAYSPDTWYAATGTSTSARTAAMTSRYASAGFTITMSAPSAMSRRTSSSASRPLCQSCW